MKIRSKVTIGLISSVLCIAAAAHAASYKKSSGGAITFTTKAVAQMLTIEGSVPGLSEITTDKGKITLKAKLKQMKIGDSDKGDSTDKGRLDHAQATLKVAQYPEAILTVAADSVSTGTGKEGKGTFTLGGKPHETKFKYDAVEKDGKINVKAQFVVKLSEHGIEKPCKLGVCVSDDTTVNVNFSVVKEP